jgi:hypothetical protein
VPTQAAQVRVQCCPGQHGAGHAETIVLAGHALIGDPPLAHLGQGPQAARKPSTFRVIKAAGFSGVAAPILLVALRFAHGFCTLAPDTEVAYKVDDYYAPDCNAGIHWADPAIGWPVAPGPFLSDAALPRLASFVSPFVYEGSS